MTTPQDPPHAHEPLRDQARRIVQQGDRIRQEIEKLFSQGAGQLKAGGRKLGDIAQEVMDGATAGLHDVASPDDRSSRLRQVIDGLGDGFSATANAARLALAEAASHGRHFARQDARQLADDLRSLGDLFVDIVGRNARKARDITQDQWQDAVNHAQRTAEHVRPALQQALDAAKDDPAELARETAQAVVQASRQAAGALLGAMGSLLHHAADKLTPADAPRHPPEADRPGADRPADAASDAAQECP